MAKQIYIYETIGYGGILAKDIYKQLTSSHEPTICFMINSSGGECFEGMAIYNAIKEYKGKTRTYIEGIAYGMASIIALACDEIFIKKGAYMVLCEPTMYRLNDVENKATFDLDKIKNVMAEIYMEKSKKAKKEVLKMMEQETWLTDKDAEINGFVDVIYE